MTTIFKTTTTATTMPTGHNNDDHNDDYASLREGQVKKTREWAVTAKGKGELGMQFSIDPNWRLFAVHAQHVPGTVV